MATKMLQHLIYEGKIKRDGFVQSILGDTQKPTGRGPGFEVRPSFEVSPILCREMISRGPFKPRFSCLNFKRKKNSAKFKGLLKSSLIEELSKSTFRSLLDLERA